MPATHPLRWSWSEDSGRQVRGGFWAFQVEQAEDLLLREPQAIGADRVREDRVEHFPFVPKYLVDALLDGPHGHHPRDGHGTRGANAVRPADRLVLHRGIPPAIKQKDVARHL